ncbi:MAG TPA: site-specific DNA-methyltransferase [Leptospiraceae bacterium]|nr:site-specific DNA-methyltransferase [Leptospiraceae bacterium]HNF16620.1 site-specific DNA-methyltransferase [Leptospiraceae bacterium]HNM04540.1 site-specific DNA-methyltransferase [Leptospiraceae bacterium]HNN02113.1 site-specific DNA-methyltransferase [Leptospiraceae bacterium]
MAKKFKGSLTLEWKNKNKSIILQNDGDNTRSTDIPLDTKLHWVNEDESLYYELDSEKGKGKKAYWVDRNDIRVKEVRPLIHKKTYIAKAIKSNKKSDLINDPSNEQEEYTVVESASPPAPLLKGEGSNGLLIKGDNLLALNTLVKHFENKPEEERPKCICIDPPYNTGSAFEHYDDNIEHSEWLTLMRDRLTLLRKILREDGFIFVQMDNNEVFYLKILMDDIFGKENFINDIIWKRRGGSANPSNHLNNVTDYLLWYKKSEFSGFNQIYSIDDDNTQTYIKERFNNVDQNGRKFMKSPLQSPNPRPNLMYNYKGYKTPKNGYSISIELMEKWDKEDKLWFPNNKDQNINRKIYLDEYKGQPISNLWTDIKVINPMSKERGDFEGGQKPEALIERLLNFSTNPGDTVLDCFGGSGTTYAVAHKMGRNWVGVEIGNHADTHIIPRMVKVLNGEDQSGISKAVGWKGGGSFSYYHLGQSIISINKKGDPDFNWKLGRAELEKSLLLTYDFALSESGASIRQRKDAGTQQPNASYSVGYKTKNGKRIAGVCSLSEEPTLSNEKGEITDPGEFMSYMEFSALLKKIGEADFIFLYTNRGIEISANEIPENMEIIKVPSSVFQELEE